MSKEIYYYSGGKRIPLTIAKDIVAIREPQDHELQESLRSKQKPIAKFPYYGINVYNSELITQTLTSGRIEMKNYELPVFKQTQDDFMVATTEFYTEFKPELTQEQIDNINKNYGVKIVERLPYEETIYKLEIIPDKNELGVVRTANAYYESGYATESEPNFIRKRHLREASSHVILEERGDVTNSSDVDFLSEQWHLQQTKVIEAWEITKGQDITICIIDDGVESAHPEYQNKIIKQRDYSNSSLPSDGNPNSNEDNHGTAVAGVSAAIGIKAYGAAPNSKLMTIRFPDQLGADIEDEMFRWAAEEGADIINCSWGPPDRNPNTDSEYPLNFVVRKAIHEAATKGRNGKGTVICWAAGNGNQSVSSDQYATHPDVLAVAACTDSEDRSYYSDFGKEIWITAPSSGGNKGIITTDRMGNKGYNNGSRTDLNDKNYTENFGGTSSSSPLVAGIVGLMLSANPNLTLLQVKEIIARTADKIGDLSSYSRETEFGKHSDLCGYGRINAQKAVEESKRRRTQV